MIPEDLLFWIAPLARTADPDQNVLCRRHADAMVVPRGWTLDDRREETPRLFKPRALPDKPSSTSKRSGRKAATGDAPVVEQLVLDGTGEIPRPSAEATHDDDTVEQPGETPWSPAFDHEDDLNGLLQVDSPLLARAFRGTDRPRS